MKGSEKQAAIKIALFAFGYDHLLKKIIFFHRSGSIFPVACIFLFVGPSNEPYRANTSVLALLRIPVFSNFASSRAGKVRLGFDFLCFCEQFCTKPIIRTWTY